MEVVVRQKDLLPLIFILATYCFADLAISTTYSFSSLDFKRMSISEAGLLAERRSIKSAVVPKERSPIFNLNSSCFSDGSEAINGPIASILMLISRFVVQLVGTCRLD